jgi:hypothetical protein
LSVDHSAPATIKEGDALFLSVKAGMTVIVKHLPGTGQPDQPESWWMADVIVVEGGARYPRCRPSFKWPKWIQLLSVGLTPIW